MISLLAFFSDKDIGQLFWEAETPLKLAMLSIASIVIVLIFFTLHNEILSRRYIVATTPLFRPTQTVEHVKTRGQYEIVLAPDNTKMEKTQIPVYVYRSLTGLYWVRPQVEMEDGRFILVPDADSKFMGSLSL